MLRGPRDGCTAPTLLWVLIEAILLSGLFDEIITTTDNIPLFFSCPRMLRRYTLGFTIKSVHGLMARARNTLPVYIPQTLIHHAYPGIALALSAYVSVYTLKPKIMYILRFTDPTAGHALI